MKKLFTTLMSLLMVAGLLAQGTTKAGKVTVVENEEKTVVKIGDDSAFTIEEGKDTTKIKFGNKGVTIIEDEKGTRVDWDDLEDKDSEEEDENEDKKKEKKSKFKPHWAGVEVGINNYVNNDFTMELAPANSYMDLNTGRSWNFNLNFMEYGIGLGTDKVGLVTGLGIGWSNYHFDNGNAIIENEDGNIVEYNISNESASVQRSKLQTTYLTAPLLMEFQIPVGKKRLFLSGGVLGGVKLGSKTKMVYTVNGDKQKDKVKDDFNMSVLRYGFTARVGYRNLKLFANYYPTSLFEKGKGPELYPFSVGLTLLSF
ncbi:MAG: outer membrane beta-barrel protein [Bacteroidota bacterium]